MYICDTVTNSTITLQSSVDAETRVVYPQTQLFKLCTHRYIQCDHKHML